MGAEKKALYVRWMIACSCILTLLTGCDRAPSDTSDSPRPGRSKGSMKGTLKAPAIDITLEFGSQAPPLAGCTWIKGDPIDLSKVRGNQITVVEFWATWCVSCAASIPHLTKLQHQFADRNVRIVGVTEYDANNTLKMVRDYVKSRGTKMDFAIAFDSSGEVYRAYVDAAGQTILPTAFVIDKSGLIGWIGHPEYGLEEVLAQIVDGSYDLIINKKLYEIDRRINEASENGDWLGVIRGADDTLALKPDNINRWMTKFLVYTQHLHKVDDAKRCAEAALKLAKGDPSNTARIVVAIVSENDRFRCNTLANQAIQEALEVAPDN